MNGIWKGEEIERMGEAKKSAPKVTFKIQDLRPDT
jgi:hypothetical protein